MGILKGLFAVVLVGLVGGNVLRWQITDTTAITLLDIAVMVFVSAWVIWRVINRKEKKSYILLKPLAAFIITLIISLVLSPLLLSGEQIGIASLYLIRWVGYAGVYFAVKDIASTQRNYIKKGLLRAGGLLVGIGLLQYMFYPNLANLYYLGWDDHLNRLFSSFLDPNFAGAFFVLLFLFLLSPYVTAQHKIVSWWNLLLLLTCIAIILAYSRTGIVMLFIGIVSMLWLSGKKKWIIGMVICSVLGLFVLSLTFTSENTNLLRTASTTARVESMGNAIEIIRKHPILGVGFNAYRYAQTQYGLVEYYSRFPSHAGAGTDNSYLFVLATSGMVGLSAYVWMLYTIITLGRTHLRLHKQEAVVLLSSLIALCVGGLFNNLLFYPAIMVWMWILVGLTEST